jgi:hypothetical protein
MTASACGSLTPLSLLFGEGRVSDGVALKLAAALSVGLDLCVRARKLDAQDRTNIMLEEFPDIDMERSAPRLTALQPWAPYETRSATIPVWVQEQYDRDLAEWEASTRKLLLESGLAVIANPVLPRLREQP